MPKTMKNYLRYKTVKNVTCFNNDNKIDKRAIVLNLLNIATNGTIKAVIHKPHLDRNSSQNVSALRSKSNKRKKEKEKIK